jgi:hypothetical protein
MRLSVSESLFDFPAWLRGICLTAMVLSLCACQSAAIHQVSSSEFAPFNVRPANYRIMNQVRINWEVREDVANFCTHAKSMGRQQSYLMPPMACAIWDILKGECTIVTGPVTSHVALGHELRHCFEGHFHR